MFEESVSGPFHTKFGKDILIVGEDMPPKLNSKQRPLPADFCFLF